MELIPSDDDVVVVAAAAGVSLAALDFSWAAAVRELDLMLELVAG